MNNTNHQDSSSVNLPNIKFIRAYRTFLEVLLSWEEQGKLTAMLCTKEGWHP